jgi:hypothetical protein
MRFGDLSSSAEAYINAFEDAVKSIRDRAVKDGDLVRSIGRRCLSLKEIMSMFKHAPNIHCVGMLGFALSTGIRAGDLKIVSREDFYERTGELLYNSGKLNRTEGANLGQKMSHLEGFQTVENPRTSTIVTFLFQNPEYFSPEKNRDIIEKFFFGDKRSRYSMKLNSMLTRIAETAKTREATAMDLRPTAATYIGYQITDIREGQLRLGHINGITTAEKYDKVAPPFAKVFDQVKPPHLQNPTFDQIKDWRCYEYLGKPKIKLKNGREWKDIWHWDTFVAKQVLEQIAIRKGREFKEIHGSKEEAIQAFKKWVNDVLLAQFETAINHSKEMLEERQRQTGEQVFDLSNVGPLCEELFQTYSFDIEPDEN